MPAFEDYLLREIASFGAAIRAVLKGREQSPGAEAEAISDGLRTLLGLSVDTLAALPAEALRPLFLDGDRIEVDKALTVSWLLEASAALQADPGSRHRLLLAALGVHALAVDAGPLAGEAADRLDGLTRSVHLTAVPPPTLARLLTHFEAQDRFDRAEDVVFAWLHRDVQGALAAGRGLYERLWGLPDARLKAGGLSSQEVLEGLAELERRAAADG